MFGFKEYREDLEIYMEGLILGKEKGVSAFFLRSFLSLLTPLFRCIVFLRLFVFRKGWKSSSFFGVPVLSIGNLTMGGTGKTPLVELLSHHLQKQGWKVAILSRGYKSIPLEKFQKWKDIKTGELIDSPARIVSDGKKLLLKAKNAGDEPFMLAKNIPEVVVLVDPHRARAGEFAISQLGCNFLILDDGMQHLKMQRTIEIVLVDSRSPFGTGRLIPRGTLREPPSNIRRADYIFLTKCNEERNEKLYQQIHSLNSQALMIECRHRPQFLVHLFSEKKENLSFLNGKRVASLCGIASPFAFENGLRNLGGRLELKKRFSDHHSFTNEEVENFIHRCLLHSMEALIITEKDAVRFPKIKNTSLPIYFLRIEIEILRGKQNWQKLLQAISPQKWNSIWKWTAKRLETENS